MDSLRLDSLSRALAHCSTRRRALRRGGALVAFGAALGFGSRTVAAAQSDGLVGTLDFQGPNVTGPSAGGTIEAEVTPEIGDDGAIDRGELTIDGGDAFDLVGHATGRDLNLRIEVQDGGTVTGMGNTMNFDTCECEPGDGAAGGGGDIACLVDRVLCQGGCVDAWASGQEMDMDTCFCQGETPVGN